MKRNLKITLSVLLILALGLGGYLYFHPKRALNVILPEFNSIETAYISFLQDTALIEAGVQIENKSIFKLNIDSLIYNIKLDTLTMLSKAQDLDIQLVPSQVDTIMLPVKLPFKRLMNEIKHLQKQDSVGITFDLRVAYSTWLGNASLPYKKTITIAVPVPPRIEIGKLEYTGRDKKLFHFSAQVKVINQGKLDLHLSNIHYKLVVKENLKAEGTEQKEIHLKPASEQSIVLPITVKFDNVFKTLIDVATDNDKVDYVLTVSAQAQMDKLGKEKTEIVIEKKGITELKK